VLRSLDLSLLRLFRSRGHPPALETAVAAFSRLGEHGAGWYALAAAGAVLDDRNRNAYRHAAIVTLAAFAANQAIKFTVRRRRPRLADLPPLTDTVSELSYPSAHASTSFAAARAFSRALPSPPLYAMALAMALSRPYLGVHYPTDSVAGAALGDAVARFAQ
jgi:membrane-associated phospholipid phosphatase